VLRARGGAREVDERVPDAERERDRQLDESYCNEHAESAIENEMLDRRRLNGGAVHADQDAMPTMFGLERCIDRRMDEGQHVARAVRRTRDRVGGLGPGHLGLIGYSGPSGHIECLRPHPDIDIDEHILPCPRTARLPTEDMLVAEPAERGAAN
jgi:hypothetical protein